MIVPTNLMLKLVGRMIGRLNIGRHLNKLEQNRAFLVVHADVVGRRGPAAERSVYAASRCVCPNGWHD